MNFRDFSTQFLIKFMEFYRVILTWLWKMTGQKLTNQKFIDKVPQDNVHTDRSLFRQKPMQAIAHMDKAHMGKGYINKTNTKLFKNLSMWDFVFVGYCLCGISSGLAFVLWTFVMHLSAWFCFVNICPISRNSYS